MQTHVASSIAYAGTGAPTAGNGFDSSHPARGPSTSNPVYSHGIPSNGSPSENAQTPGSSGSPNGNVPYGTPKAELTGC